MKTKTERARRKQNAPAPDQDGEEEEEEKEEEKETERAPAPAQASKKGSAAIPKNSITSHLRATARKALNKATHARRKGKVHLAVEHMNKIDER